MSSYSARISDRVAARPISSLAFVELFAGPARLCTAVRNAGLQLSFAFDAHIKRDVTCTVLHLDLTTETSAELLFSMLSMSHVVAIHVELPLRTALRGRTASTFRSDVHAEGLPGLSSEAQSQVAATNRAFDLCAKVFNFAYQAGVLVSCAHPRNSFFWSSRAATEITAMPDAQTSTFHHCMFGAAHDRCTRILHLGSSLAPLAVPCNKLHPHAPWSEVRNLPHVCPANFCRAFAMCIVNRLLLAGATAAPTSLRPEHTRLHIASRIAVGSQPSRSKATPLIPEFKCLCKLSGAWDSLPAGPALRTAFQPSAHGLSCTPAVHILPPGERVLSRLPVAKGEGRQSTETWVTRRPQPLLT